MAFLAFIALLAAPDNGFTLNDEVPVFNVAVPAPAEVAALTEAQRLMALDGYATYLGRGGLPVPAMEQAADAIMGQGYEFLAVGVEAGYGEEEFKAEQERIAGDEEVRFDQQEHKFDVFEMGEWAGEMEEKALDDLGQLNDYREEHKERLPEGELQRFRAHAPCCQMLCPLSTKRVLESHSVLGSHPIPSHPIHPIPSHPIPSHPIPSHPYGERRGGKDCRVVVKGVRVQAGTHTCEETGDVQREQSRERNGTPRAQVE
jgi:hypothetical protein